MALAVPDNLTPCTEADVWWRGVIGIIPIILYQMPLWVPGTHLSQIIPQIFPGSPLRSVIVLPEEGHVHRAIPPVLSDVCLEMMSIAIKFVWRTQSLGQRDRPCELGQIDVPVQPCVCVTLWWNPLPGAGRFWYAIFWKKQNKILQSCSGKMFLDFCQLYWVSSSQGQGRNFSKNNTERGKQQGMKF